MKTMIAVVAMLVVLALAAAAWGQVAVGETPVEPVTKATTIDAQTALLGQGDPPENLTKAAGYDPQLRGEYLAALQPKAEALTGATKALALMQVYRDLVGYAPDSTGLAERMVAALEAAPPDDRVRLVSTLMGQFFLHRAAALRYVDTPDLAGNARRTADALGVYLKRQEPKHLAAAVSLRRGIERAALWRAWPLTDQVSLRRLLVLMPVADHARYVTFANAHLVTSRTADLAKAVEGYQAYLKDGTGGTDVLAGATIPTDDALSDEANRLLADADLALDVDSRVDLLLVAGRNREAFQAAETAMSTHVDPRMLSANVHRLAKVIKAVDGHWKRATDYVNLFQPRPEGEPAPVDPIPAVKQELGL
jgi:hypothetical protein